jgi:phage N-6-adenine-methyltransferase
MAAVVARFGKMTVDLAASHENTQAPVFVSEKIDSLSVNWGDFGGNLWLNPPYARIGLWAEKCARAACLPGERRIFLLVPASVGSNWYANFVEPYASVLFLNPRLTFVGHTQTYPKDLMLAVYARGVVTWKPFAEPARVWRWKGSHA